jgi:NAD+ diphosphatase
MLQEIAPHRFDNAFRSPRPREGDAAVVFDGRDVLLSAGRFPTAGELLAQGAEDAAFVYLFAVDDLAFFLLPEPSAAVRESLERADAVLTFRGMEPYYLRLAGATALHLADWYRLNRFCGRCGAQTVRDGAERAMRCPRCGNIVYPRINPAIIAAVRHGDRLLLTRYANRKMLVRYALIAGFTEIGETLEDTVRREVLEEVGLRVKNVRYHGNQPWGFSGNLMVGFWADLDGDDTVTLETSELSEGVWLRREEIPATPDPIDLTHSMIELFRLGRDPR